MNAVCRIAILAKAPLAGYAKTRLMPALGAAGAAALAERLLEHAVAQAVAAGLGPVTLWAAPDLSHPVFARLAGRHGLELRPQGEGDLGTRMARVFETTWAATPGPLLLMGTDAPTLDAARLRDAAAALQSHDAVFVPALDGGYALIGLRAWAPRLHGLFEAMRWSTPQVMADTRGRLAAAGLRHAERPAVPDIDEAADLVHLPAAWGGGAALTIEDSRRSSLAMSDPTSPAEPPAPAVPLPAAPAAEQLTVAGDPAPSEAAAAEAAEAAAQPGPDQGADADAGPGADVHADAAAATSPESSAAGREGGTADTLAPAATTDATAGATAAADALPAAAPAPPPAAAELSPAACAARLAELFPALFGAGRALPIKLRIQNDIQQRAPGVFTRKSLSPFLHRYTTSTAYLKALVQSPHRFDLDGAPAGDIDDVHRQAAATELERRRGLFEAKRAAERAAAQEARRAAEAAARQQHAAEDQARRERAALLRAYESSTLTRANFCVLKGIPEAELDGRLHQAWLEREQRAQELRPVAGQAPAPGEARPPQRPPQRPGPRREARPGGPGGERAAGGGPGEKPRAEARPPRPGAAPGPRPGLKPQR